MLLVITSRQTEYMTPKNYSGEYGQQKENILIKMKPIIFSSRDAFGPQGKWSRLQNKEHLLINKILKLSDK